jgi:hypothetical protein
MNGDVLAMFQQHGRDAWMAFQYADEFGSAIAAISYDSCRGLHCLNIHFYA